MLFALIAALFMLNTSGTLRNVPQQLPNGEPFATRFVAFLAVGCAILLQQPFKARGQGSSQKQQTSSSLPEMIVTCEPLPPVPRAPRLKPLRCKPRKQHQSSESKVVVTKEKKVSSGLSARFDKVSIREMELQVGGGGAVCTHGCPLGIGWEVVNEYTHDVDTYEELRELRRTPKDQYWYQGILSAAQRKTVLLKSGATWAELNRSARDCISIHQQRCESNETTFSCQIDSFGQVP